MPKQAKKKKVPEKKRLAKIRETNQRYKQRAADSGLVPMSFKKFVPADLKPECLAACHQAVAAVVNSHSSKLPEVVPHSNTASEDRNTSDTSAAEIDEFDQSLPDDLEDFSQL